MVSQEDKIGAMKTKTGTLLYFNDENPFTIELEGELNLNQFPLIGLNDKNFQIITNTAQTKSTDIKALLQEYMNWEINYLKETFPDVVKAKSEFIENKGELMHFWYYQNPVIEDAPADIKPFKMTFLLDWKKDHHFYKLVYPSYNEDVESAKLFLVELKNKIHYYTSKIDLERLYENIQKGNNYYVE